MELIEIDQLFIGLRNDHILHVYIKEKTALDKNLQHWLLIAYNHLAGDKKYPLIFEGGEFVDLTADGKAYAKEVLHEIPVICEAIIVKNMAQLIIASFFLKFNKAPFKMKIFKHADKATNWCLEQAEINEAVLSNKD